MVRILMVEDSPADALLVRGELEVSLGELDFERVETAPEFTEALRRKAWDVILADHRLPAFDSRAALEILQRSGRDIPFIIVSGSIGEDLAVAAMRSGAHDFVNKGNLSRLGPAIERELREARVRHERAQAELLLGQTQQRLAALLESTHDRVFTFDRGVHPTAAYGAWLREEGRTAENLAGLEPSEAFGEDQAAQGDHYRRALEGEQQVYPWTAPRAGQVRHYQTSLSPIRGPGGEVVGGVGIIRDITQLKEMEVQLAMSERLVSVGTLAASVAHEINNPLVSLLTNLEIAVEAVANLGDPSVRGHLEEVLLDARLAAGRVRETARDLRMLSRGDDGRVGPVDVCRVLDSCLRLALNEVRHRAVVKRIYAPVPPVRGNEAHLAQVFLNLIVNAAQSIPEGAADRNVITVRAAARGAGEVAIEIEDTGCGIGEDVRARLFTPFFTTKPMGVGTGLGLSISQRIVSSFGGHIEVESTTGVGSVFRVVLPTENAAPTPERADLVPVPMEAPRRGRILVVDDDEQVSRAIQRTLSRQHEVVLSDGPGAVARAEAGERFDLVFCDLMMPVMTGMEVYRRVRERAPELAARFVFLSGGAFTPAAQAFVVEHDSRCVFKPFEPGQLRQLVNQALR